jgi:putative selenium metabolism protein SsnA
MSLLIHGGTVVTALHPAAVTSADILVEDGRVASVGSTRAAPDDAGLPSPAAPDARSPTAAPVPDRLDAGGCLVIPGNVNAHMHLYSALARGMPYRLAPPTDFLQILQRVWWRLDRALDDDGVRASALAGGMEALLAGTTTLIDHHASPNAIDGSLDIIADALAELGLRSVCCYEVSDRDGPDRARAGLRESRRFATRCGDAALPLARAMVGAHASFTLSDETLGACVEIAHAAGIGVHVHAAEDAVDETAALRAHGQRVAARLADDGVLNERTLLAHGVHLDADEVEIVRASGATLAHNARSNMNNAVGRTPLAGLGDRVALGTDGIGSDMFTESQAAFFRHREDGTPAPDWPLARLAEGAQLAGRSFHEPLLGGLEPGAPADLVVLDYDPPTPFSADSLPGHWLYGLGSRHVRDVVVAGRVVVRDRRMTLVDQDALVAEAREQAARLWDRLETIPAHHFDPLAH